MRDRDVHYNMTRSSRTSLNCIGGLCAYCPFNGYDTCLTARISPHMPVQPKSLERGERLMEILNHGETPWIWYTYSMDSRSNSVWWIRSSGHLRNDWYRNPATATLQRFVVMNVRCMLWISMIRKYVFAYIEDPPILSAACWRYTHDSITVAANTSICLVYAFSTINRTAARLRKTSCTRSRRLPYFW